jgi:hypothetical protein
MSRFLLFNSINPSRYLPRNLERTSKKPPLQPPNIIPPPVLPLPGHHCPRSHAGATQAIGNPCPTGPEFPPGPAGRTAPERAVRPLCEPAHPPRSPSRKTTPSPDPSALRPICPRPPPTPPPSLPSLSDPPHLRCPPSPTSPPPLAPPTAPRACNLRDSH